MRAQIELIFHSGNWEDTKGWSDMETHERHQVVSGNWTGPVWAYVKDGPPIAPTPTINDDVYVYRRFTTHFTPAMTCRSYFGEQGTPMPISWSFLPGWSIGPLTRWQRMKNIVRRTLLPISDWWEVRQARKQGWDLDE